MARIACTNSRIRDAGFDQGWLKRFSMCGRICVPSPRTKRPSDRRCRSWAICAQIIGLRAKAIATPVPSSGRCVACEASASGKNGSCGPSNE